MNRALVPSDLAPEVILEPQTQEGLLFRGEANKGLLTAEGVVRLTQVLSKTLLPQRGQRRVIIGKDTRLSGHMLEHAMAAGFIGSGVDVSLVDTLPTPAVAFLTKSMRADLGVMISASHNPYHDNGLKLFGSDGYPIDASLQKSIEAQVISGTCELASPESIGRTRHIMDAAARYVEWAKHSFPRDIRLDGLRVILDSAHGAAHETACNVLWELGADVVEIGNSPNGLNINSNCGCIHPEQATLRVLERRGDIGLAFDGDADRVLVIDDRGNLIDGDQILALIAEHWHSQGRLAGSGVAVTILSNSGLVRHLKKLGINVEVTPPGQQHLIECLRANNFVLGGDQLGHIILRDYATTADGMIAALQILAIIKQVGRPASETCRTFTRVPQKVISIPLHGPCAIMTPKVNSAIEAGVMQLHGRGRVLVRRSTTEMAVRIMIEAEYPELLDHVAQPILSAIQTQVEYSHSRKFILTGAPQDSC